MNETQGRFVALLKQEATVLEELHTLLMKELAILKDRDPDAIAEISEAKNTLLNKLGMLDKQRQLYIEGEEHSMYEDGAFSEKINSLNNEIKDSLDKCKHQNNINGSIIEMSQMFNKKILDIICGNFEKEMTYSANGKSNSGSNQHSLAHV